MTLFGITVAGVLGNLVGSWIAYAVGLLRRPSVHRQRRASTCCCATTTWRLAQRWFDKYGPPPSSSAACCPIVRTFISLPAGFARMPFWKFTLYTLLGCIPWVFMLGLGRYAARRQLGEDPPVSALRGLRGRRGAGRRRRVGRRQVAQGPQQHGGPDTAEYGDEA